MIVDLVHVSSVSPVSEFIESVETCMDFVVLSPQDCIGTRALALKMHTDLQIFGEMLRVQRFMCCVAPSIHHVKPVTKITY